MFSNKKTFCLLKIEIKEVIGAVKKAIKSQGDKILRYRPTSAQFFPKIVSKKKEMVRIGINMMMPILIKW